MKKTLKVDLPDLVSIRAGLVEEPVSDAEVRAARRRLDAARDHLVACGRDIERLRVAVARGAAEVFALEGALNRAAAAQLVIGPAEAQLAAAEAAVVAAQLAARAAVVQRTRDVRNELQATADQLRPVLIELRLLESALDQAAKAAGGEPVPALRWPSAVVEDVMGSTVGQE